MDEAGLMRRYGAIGQRLRRLARAEDDRTVNPRGEAKSVSSETTFDDDLSDPERLSAVLRGLAERVSASLKKQGLAGRTVTLKLKTPDFRLRTRSRTLPSPTQLADRIWRAGAEMLAREADGSAFRPLEEHSTLAVIERAREAGCAAIGVCLLWSVVNPAHELRIGELLDKHLPGVPYTLSHRLNPAVREYRRASATVISRFCSFTDILSSSTTQHHARYVPRASLADAGTATTCCNRPPHWRP